MKDGFLARAGIFLAGLALTSSLHAQVGPVPGMGPLMFPTGAAGCVPVVTNIGTNSNTSGATLTLSGVTVPAGSLLVVLVTEGNASGTAGSVSDGTNTYSSAATQTNNNTNNDGIGAIFFAPNASLSGGTITYTKQTSGDASAISAIYASNVLTSSPQDTAVTAKAFGTSANPSVTSGTPAQSGELFIGALSILNGSSVTVTQDTGHGWASPPNSASASSISFNSISGGEQVNSGSGTKVYAPTISASVSGWGQMIVGFKHC